MTDTLLNILIWTPLVLLGAVYVWALSIDAADGIVAKVKAWLEE